MDRPPRSIVRGRPLRAALLALLLGLQACGDSPLSSGSNLTPGTIATNPSTGGLFVVEENLGGDAGDLFVKAILWGRLVDIRDMDPLTGQPAATPLFVDYLIDSTVQSDGVDFLLERNPVTGVDELTILHENGTPAFTAAFNQLEAGLQPFITKGLGAGTLPPYTALPRNGAFAVVFNDLLNDGGDPGDPGYPGSVLATTLKIRVGYPPSVPFEYRAIPDRNHGDLLGGKFHSTRAIVDLAVSQLESQTSGAPVNAVGLPSALNTALPNVALRIPTKLHAASGQLELLTNLGGKTVSFTGNGPTDPTSPTLDVVRGLRSGGKTLITGDPFNGFLQDQDPPSVLGSQAVFVTNVFPLGGGKFVLDFAFQTVTCATSARPGDALVLAGAVVQVIVQSSPPAGGIVTGVQVRQLTGPASAVSPGAGEFRAPFDPALGHLPACFVRFTPLPLVPPAGGVSQNASITVSFTEPMDPDSVEAFESFRIIDPTVPATKPLEETLSASIAAALDSATFTSSPAVPLKHVLGQTETYQVDVSAGPQGTTDLAGNGLSVVFPAPSFTLIDSEPTANTGTFALRFTGPDENGDGFPEIRGQLVLNPALGSIRPRSLTRFSSFLDSTSQSAPTVQAMGPGSLTGGLEPLSRYGCRLMNTWRYHDLGLALYFDPDGTGVGAPAMFDDLTLNLDVEGLAWVPGANGVNLDQFPDFRMAFAHSLFLPDELFDLKAGASKWPSSGLITAFDSNLLEPLTVVHKRDKGYLVQPLDSFLAGSGTLMMPWPLNRNVPQSQFVYWTYRDTTVLGVGAPFGQGAPTGQEQLLVPGTVAAYGADKVPTIGLPFLMEYRTVADPTQIAINGITAGAGAPLDPAGKPWFRAFSDGGILPDGTSVKIIDPYNEPIAQGGLNFGQPTAPADFIVDYGQADFVVRVNQVHTIWFNATGQSTWAPAVIEPNLTTLPPGTQVKLAFRGAANVSGSGVSDADKYDPYGNALPTGGGPSVIFFNGDATWHENIQDLAGAQFLQVRMTMISNPETGVSPEIQALGFAYQK